MRALLALMMRGRTQAMTASAVFATLSLLVPPLGYASGALIGLATLKQGPREGALVIAGSVLLAGIFATLMVGTPLPALIFLAVSWLPAWLLAVVLASTRSPGTTLVVATLLGAVAVLALHLAVPDPAQWWRESMERLFGPALEGAVESAGEQQVAQVRAMMEQAAPLATRFVGMTAVVGLMLPMLLARWGHAVLDNPGGFGKEFRELRVGNQALLVSMGLGLLAVFAGDALGGLPRDLMGPVTAMLVFQGIAVTHGVVHNRGAATGWLVAMYLLLVVLPQPAMLALSMTALLDGVMNFRERSRKPT